MDFESRIKRVFFADKKLLAAYEKLKAGTSEEKQLAAEIGEAIAELKQNPLYGIKLPRRLWPKEYIKLYSINNLRKCDLRSGWRITYTLTGSEVEIISILLEWMTHKQYEERFNYKVR